MVDGFGNKTRAGSMGRVALGIDASAWEVMG